MSHAYYLGLPIWQHPLWPGEFTAATSRGEQALADYATVFNTVEGNTTFYGLPRPATVQRWAANTPPGFRFCFKFPRVISHQQALAQCDRETRNFLDTLAPLGERLGPLFLQLPPRFGPDGLDTLRGFLDRLPRGFRYAVEVRHRAFFAKGEAETALNRLLHERQMDRVILDSRALFHIPTDDPDGLDARRRKPRLPVHALALTRHPLVRFIGHPQREANTPFLAPWLDKLGTWLDEGRQPFFFVHTPSNRDAPALARLFHQQLAARLALPPLPRWPAEQAQPAQLGLF